MSARTVLNGFGVFGDEVYTSTDLNRRAGEVLNHARTRPVTISRNNEQFALLRREEVANLVRTVACIEQVVEILSEANAAIGDAAPSLSWLTVYEKDDLKKLCAEILAVTRSAILYGGDWDLVENTIHEWRESALLAKSGTLDRAMYEEAQEETELPDPDTLLDVALEAECPTTNKAEK